MAYVRDLGRAFLYAMTALATATPARAQAVDVQARLEHYPIFGRTAEALLREMQAKGPPGTFEPEKRYFARAEYSVGWQYQFAKVASGCAISEFDVSVDTTYTYPLWEDRDKAGAKLNGYWDYFMSRLEIHERGHGDLALATGVDVAKALKALTPRPTCDALKSAINAAARDAMKTGDKKQRAYDRETNHGETQGAWFDTGDVRRYKVPKTSPN
jgi:predicted secreted Zn-dependent protease